MGAVQGTLYRKRHEDQNFMCVFRSLCFQVEGRGGQFTLHRTTNSLLAGSKPGALPGLSGNASTCSIEVFGSRDQGPGFKIRV